MFEMSLMGEVWELCGEKILVLPNYALHPRFGRLGIHEFRSFKRKCIKEQNNGIHRRRRKVSLSSVVR